MSELYLGKRHTTRYGKRYKGVVETENDTIPITWREPYQHDDVAYVLATGWLGAKNSMRLPAHEAVSAGHIAITFDYTNKGALEPLGHNSEILSATLDALPEEFRKAAIGLSMGGRVLTEALTKVESRVETATLVASAGYIKNQISYVEGFRHILATAPESMEMFRHNSAHAMRVGATAVANSIRRNRAVVAEMKELINGTAHHFFEDIKSQSQPPHMRFIYGSKDNLLPAQAQKEGVEGLDFDHIESYDGGHLRLIDDPTLSRHIFELDSEILEKTQVRNEAFLKNAA